MLKGFICPPSGEEPGRKNTLSYCVNKCKAPCVAPNVLAAMWQEAQDNPHKGKIISVSQLAGGCDRKTYLERTEDFHVEPERMLPTFRGTLVHSLIEESAKIKVIKKAGWLLEQNMQLPVTSKSGDWTLSGTLDAFDPLRATLFDTKTLQDYAVGKLVKGQENGRFSNHISDHYVIQQNMYRYMGEKLGLFVAKRLRLQIITFGGLILTGTTVQYKGKEYEVPDVPVVPNKLLEELIQTRGDEWYRILFLGERPKVCDSEHAWLCKRCQFLGTTHCPNPELERNGEWNLFSV